MSHRKTDTMPSLQLTSQERIAKSEWGAIVMGILSKTPESMTLFEIHHMMREMNLATRESAKEVVRLRYCLYSVLSILTITSAILSAVFYLALGMTTIGLSFLGPLITGIIGLVVVHISGKK